MSEEPGTLYAVVLAGGTGTRPWAPSPGGPPHVPHPLTGAAHAAAGSRQLTGVPEENVLVEPSPRDSCAAIALAAAVIARRDPEAIMGSFASDHLISDTTRFSEVIRQAMVGAEKGFLMTLGITPTRPETGYGYLQCGPAVAGSPVLAVEE